MQNVCFRVRIAPGCVRLCHIDTFLVSVQGLQYLHISHLHKADKVLPKLNEFNVPISMLSLPE